MSSTTGEPAGPSAAATAVARDADVAGAEAIVARAGYRPEPRRSLRFFSMFAIAFSIISITTGIFLNYGVGLADWGPAAIWTWPIVGVCNMMIALVVAELGTRIPLAGYAYQWSARLGNPTYGGVRAVARRVRPPHPTPAGRPRLPVERPAGDPHLRLVRRLRRAALHGRRRRRDHAR